MYFLHTHTHTHMRRGRKRIRIRGDRLRITYLSLSWRLFCAPREALGQGRGGRVKERAGAKERGFVAKCVQWCVRERS
jgi:hypothetical protein